MSINIKPLELKMGLYFVIIVKPDALYMNIGKAVKENTEKSVECRVSSSNPASLVDIDLFIDGNKHTYTTLKQADGSYNGKVKTFVFTFKTERHQNGKVAKCCLRWDGKYIQMEKKASLNITCK